MPLVVVVEPVIVAELALALVLVVASFLAPSIVAVLVGGVARRCAARNEPGDGIDIGGLIPALTGGRPGPAMGLASGASVIVGGEPSAKDPTVGGGSGGSGENIEDDTPSDDDAIGGDEETTPAIDEDEVCCWGCCGCCCCCALDGRCDGGE